MIPNGRPEDGKKGPVWIAVYTRKSNDENLTGEVTSLESQRSCCRSYIDIQRDKGWREYPEAFDDPAESGKSLSRPAMRRLLKAVEEGKVQGIIVYKLDRLTRNSRDFHSLLELFEKRGVAFISATESIDTKSPQGRLMTAIMVQFAQYDREMDVERSKDMHFARAQKGLWSAGLPPLGYDLKDKALVVNEKEADLVRHIFNLYLELQSSIRVAEELNRQGYHRKVYRTLGGKPYGGKPFDMDSVTRTLQRKAYIGFITNERTGKAFPGQHKPIISAELFERVQKIIASRNHRGGEIHYSANKHGFKLKGLLRCGECGNPVVGYSRIKGGKTYRYYRCLAQKNGLPVKCAFGSAGADKVEEYVVEKLSAVGWDRALLERVVEKANEKAKKSIAPIEKERQGVLDRLQTIQRDIRQLLNLVKETGSSREAAEEIRTLETTKRDLEARVAELDAQASFRKRVVYDVDAVQGALQRFARFFYRIPLASQIRIIQLLVQRVQVWRNKIKVDIHEVGIPDLQRALGGKEEVAFGARRLKARRGPNATCLPDFPRHPTGTSVVESRGDWRGRRGQNPTGLIRPFVPPSEKAQYIPPLPLAWPYSWARITDGEKVISEVPGASAASQGQPQPLDFRNPVVLGDGGTHLNGTGGV